MVNNSCSGVYAIVSKTIPYRCYIGSAINIDRRWQQHLWHLNKGTHHSRKLQRHHDKYGCDDLLFAIIERASKDELLKNEQAWLDFSKPYFNGRPLAQTQLGFKHSEETKKKISAIKTGNKFWVGKKHSPESKAKMRLARLGRKPSPLAIARLRIVHKGNKHALGNKNRLGATFTEEQKQKISAGLKKYFASKKATDETLL